MGSWIAKSLGISAAVALVTGIVFYLFFNIHRELEIQLAYAYRLAVVAFVLSAIVSMIYFRTQRNR
jgi:multidrug transporter EmrE-like cation transporter